MTDPLQAQQQALAAWLRAPDTAPLPEGVDQRGLQVYQRLFRGNIAALLGANFPLIRQILTAHDWNQLVDDFCREHHAHSPLFTEIGKEFVHYLGHRDQQRQPPWLAELAHYEWVELALRIDDSEPPPFQRDGDLLHGCPLLSPQAWPLAYRWPVQRIGPDMLPSEPPSAPTLLLARRDPDGQVRFAELSPWLAQLLWLLGEDPPRSGNDCLQRLADAAAPADRAAFLAEATALLTRLHAERIVLGTRIAPD